MAKVWWIKREGPGRLGLATGIAGESLKNDLRELRMQGADEVVTLLTEDELAQLGLADVAAEADQAGIAYKRYSVDADGLPDMNRGLDDFLQAMHHDLMRGKRIVLHCDTGRGRCAMIAGALLALEGVSPEASLRMLRAARHTAAPDKTDQRDWLHTFAGQANPQAVRRARTTPARRIPRSAWLAALGVLGVGAAALSFLRMRGVSLRPR